MKEIPDFNKVIECLNNEYMQNLKGIGVAINIDDSNNSFELLEEVSWVITEGKEYQKDSFGVLLVGFITSEDESGIHVLIPLLETQYSIVIAGDIREKGRLYDEGLLSRLCMELEVRTLNGVYKGQLTIGAPKLWR